MSGARPSARPPWSWRHVGRRERLDDLPGTTTITEPDGLTGLVLVRDDELLGFWSQDMLYTSSMEDHWLVFRRRGEGCYAYLRPGTLRGSVFTWRLDGDRLTTRAVRSFRGDLHAARRGDGVALDLRGTVVSLSERFAFQLQQRTRVLELSNLDRGIGGWRLNHLDLAYLRPDGPDVLLEQIRRAHAWFDRRGGLPRPAEQAPEP
jgi:hypothetical protein